MERKTIEQEVAEVLTDIRNGATYYINEDRNVGWEFANGSDVFDATGWGWACLKDKDSLRIVNGVLEALVDFYREAHNKT